MWNKANRSSAGGKHPYYHLIYKYFNFYHCTLSENVIIAIIIIPVIIERTSQQLIFFHSIPNTQFCWDSCCLTSFDLSAIQLIVNGSMFFCNIIFQDLHEVLVNETNFFNYIQTLRYSSWYLIDYPYNNNCTLRTVAKSLEAA